MKKIESDKETLAKLDSYITSIEETVREIAVHRDERVCFRASKKVCLLMRGTRVVKAYLDRNKADEAEGLANKWLEEFKVSTQQNPWDKDFANSLGRYRVIDVELAF